MMITMNNTNIDFKKLENFEIELKNLNKEKKRIQSIITPTNITPIMFQYIINLCEAISKKEKEYGIYLNELNTNSKLNVNISGILDATYNKNYSFYKECVIHQNDIMIAVNALTYLKYSLSN